RPRRTLPSPSSSRALPPPPVRRQLFSTAVAVATDADADCSAPANDSRGPLSSQRQRTDERMPRLQALRDRLRTEDEERPGSGARTHERAPALRPIENLTRVSEEPTIEYSHGHSPDVDLSDENILTDSHGRHHNYLRISLSERCNLRCRYCMPPEGVPLSPPSHLLTDDEVLRLVRLFVKNGVTKVRLTGGEPLLRPNLASLVRSISDALPKDEGDARNDVGTVGITTNGLALSRQIDALVDAGLTGANVSLDTLRPDRFREITRRNGLDKVLRAIDDCRRAFRAKYGDVRVVGPDGTGGSRVKINCVVMRGFNDDEVGDFARMADERFGGDVDVRFIEWMPFNDNGWNGSKFFSYRDMMERISEGGTTLVRAEDGPNDTTKWWRARRSRDVDGDAGRARVGFITSMSEHFCASCNRLRITADGKIKVCLFGSNEKEVSLRDILRRRNEDPEAGEEEEEELARAVQAAVRRKTIALGGHGSAEGIAEAADNRPMTLIGG
ncbi:hypothetical protein ACHAWF_004197, partial [Thalassiosira exigua]